MGGAASVARRALGKLPRPGGKPVAVAERGVVATHADALVSNRGNAVMVARELTSLVALWDRYRPQDAPVLAAASAAEKLASLVSPILWLHRGKVTVARPGVTLLSKLVLNDRGLAQLREANGMNLVKALHSLYGDSDPGVMADLKIVYACLRGVANPEKALAGAEAHLDAELVLLVLQHHRSNRAVHERGMSLLSSFAKDERLAGFMLQMVDLIDTLMASMSSHPRSNRVQLCGCTTVRELGRNPAAAREFGRAGAVDTILSLVKPGATEVDAAAAGAGGDKDGGESENEAEAGEQARGDALHAGIDTDTQQQALWALEQLVAGYEGNAWRLKEAGGRTVLRDVAARLPVRTAQARANAARLRLAEAQGAANTLQQLRDVARTAGEPFPYRDDLARVSAVLANAQADADAGRSGLRMLYVPRGLQTIKWSKYGSSLEFLRAEAARDRAAMLAAVAAKRLQHASKAPLTMKKVVERQRRRSSRPSSASRRHSRISRAHSVASEPDEARDRAAVLVGRSGKPAPGRRKLPPLLDHSPVRSPRTSASAASTSGAAVRRKPIARPASAQPATRARRSGGGGAGVPRRRVRPASAHPTRHRRRLRQKRASEGSQSQSMLSTAMSAAAAAARDVGMSPHDRALRKRASGAGSSSDSDSSDDLLGASDVDSAAVMLQSQQESNRSLPRRASSRASVGTTLLQSQQGSHNTLPRRASSRASMRDLVQAEEEDEEAQAIVTLADLEKAQRSARVELAREQLVAMAHGKPQAATEKSNAQIRVATDDPRAGRDTRVLQFDRSSRRSLQAVAEEAQEAGQATEREEEEEEVGEAASAQATAAPAAPRQRSTAHTRRQRPASASADGRRRRATQRKRAALLQRKPTLNTAATSILERLANKSGAWAAAVAGAGKPAVSVATKPSPNTDSGWTGAAARATLLREKRELLRSGSAPALPRFGQRKQGSTGIMDRMPSSKGGTAAAQVAAMVAADRAGDGSKAQALGLHRLVSPTAAMHGDASGLGGPPATRNFEGALRKLWGMGALEGGAAINTLASAAGKSQAAWAAEQAVEEHHQRNGGGSRQERAASLAHTVGAAARAQLVAGSGAVVTDGDVGAGAGGGAGVGAGAGALEMPQYVSSAAAAAAVAEAARGVVSVDARRSRLMEASQALSKSLDVGDGDGEGGGGGSSSGGVGVKGVHSEEATRRRIEDEEVRGLVRRGHNYHHELAKA